MKLMETSLLKTPLFAAHTKLNSRLVPFAGWSMPVQYKGALSEVSAVRNHVGIFDVSHMGRFLVEGLDSRELLNWVHSADLNISMPIGRARYGVFCNETGGIIDDGVVYRLGENKFLVVANASNSDKVLEWITQWRNSSYPQSSIANITQNVSMIAMQGPKAIQSARSIFNYDISGIKPFRIREVGFQNQSLWIARTGYTGEDGIEIMPNSSQSITIWEALIDHGVVPCGLAARDVLRLEAGLLLHGNDIDENTNPIEAGLQKFLTLEGSQFCGSESIKSFMENPYLRKLVGFKTSSRGPVPRPHCLITTEEGPVGEVSSGGYSPSLDTNIGLGYVRYADTQIGHKLNVVVRDHSVGIEIVDLPFYKRQL